MAAIGDEEAIDTFVTVTGASHSIALQTLQAHNGDLYQAVDAYFSKRVGNSTSVAPTSVAHLNDDIDTDTSIPVGTRPSRYSLFPSAEDLSPFPFLDPGIRSRFFDSGPDFGSSTPFVSHPKEVREIPIEVKDSGEKSGHSGHLPKIEDVTGTVEQGPETHGQVKIEDDDEVVPDAPRFDDLQDNNLSPPRFDDLPNYYNVSPPRYDDLLYDNDDIEEEMVRAAIEASKLEEMRATDTQPESYLEDPDLAHAVLLSLKTAEQEKALRELGGSLEAEVHKSAEMRDAGKRALLDERLEVGSSYVQDESKDVEGQKHPQQIGSDFPEDMQMQLAAKASLPPEPNMGDENVVNILVRMPNGNLLGRRFLKSDKLQHLFDFIDSGRVVERGIYKLVKSYPPRVFSLEESNLSLEEAELISKQEVLFLQKI